jgi:hypothetical protein
MEAVPFRERIACSVSDALRHGPFKRDKLYDLIKDGRIESKMIDGRRIIVVRSFLALIEGVVTQPITEPPAQSKRRNRAREVRARARA